MKDPAAAARDKPRPREPVDFVVGKRMGSFTDYEAANKLVSATLLRNRERVDCLVEGKSSKDEASSPHERSDMRGDGVPDVAALIRAT
jgi:hypothetical protein